MRVRAVQTPQTGVTLPRRCHSSAHAFVRRVPLPELAKSSALAAAFFFWAANQLWPRHPQATLFNDIAVALFVVDVFLTLRAWRESSDI